MGDWNAIKAQARQELGIELVDTDVFNVPLIAADLYGHFIADPDTGFPQLVLAGVVDNPATPDDERLVSGTPPTQCSPLARSRPAMHSSTTSPTTPLLVRARA